MSQKINSFNDLYRKPISDGSTPRKSVGVSSRGFLKSIRDFIPEAELIEDFRSVHKFDLIIFPGGEDINPLIYGRRLTYANGVNVERDERELIILDRALYTDKYILGICRGHQLINARLGGNLYQDLIMEGQEMHSPIHPLEFMGDVVVKKFFEGKDVVSTHHQAVKNPGSDLTITSMHNGIVESCESSNIITIQFHPEFQSPDTQHVVDFFNFLVEDW